MKLICGLGNPGSKYRANRHNLGFMVVDDFARERGLSWRFSRDWSCYFIRSGEYVLIKPSTFMNRSGGAIRKVADYFKIDADDVLVVYDDIDLPFGKIRLAFNGLSAGHHGIDSVIESLGMEFGRLRVGISSPRNEVEGKEEVSDYVLSDFSSTEKRELGRIISKSAEAITSYLDEGLNSTMNRFN